ncbi:MAG: DUF5011 domain-containing protein [Bacteroidetes bacterium]|jgi:hypothetical protein|nr:DUF5011 domain-containing protein [Bacteroidota bacterium]
MNDKNLLNAMAQRAYFFVSLHTSIFYMKIIVKSFLFLSIIMLAFSACEKDEELADKYAPFIIINGENPLWIRIGDTYTDAGAKAYDVDESGDTINISYKLVTDNNVNTTIIGLYKVSYSVSDENGNMAEEQIRKVYVNEF